MQVSTPAILGIFILLKTPFTALLHHAFIRQQTNNIAWMCLGFMTLGMLISASPSFHLLMPLHTILEGRSRLITGAAFGVLISIISAVNAIVTELTIKKQEYPYWAGQFWLYYYGSITAVTSLGLSLAFHNYVPIGRQFRNSLTSTTTALVIVNVATGLLVAQVLRSRDNLVKLVGTSATVLPVLILQSLLLPDLSSESLTTCSIVGALLVSTSSFYFNRYKKYESEDEALLPKYHKEHALPIEPRLKTNWTAINV